MNFNGRFRDHILPENLHVLNVSFHVHTFRESFGGTAGNIAYSLALLGEKPHVLSTFGNDFIKYQAWCRQHRVDLRYSQSVKSHPTASVYIITDNDDNQISGFFPGAMSCHGALPPARLLGARTFMVVSPKNKPDMLNDIRQCKKTKTRYMFDPGQQITSFNRQELINGLIGAHSFISNDYELSMVLKKVNWPIATLFKNVPLVITTKGSKGSVIFSEGKKILIPSAKPKNTSDPTGAGDAYRAGFIKGLQLGLPLEQAGRLGAVVSVYSVETYGTQTHRFTWQDVKKRYRKNFKEKI
jgi:adenosine kinase